MKRVSLSLQNGYQYLTDLLAIKRYLKGEEQVPTILFGWLNRLSIIIATLLLIAAYPQVYAQTIEATGRAVITGSLSSAREQAIKDALRQASYRQDLALKSYQKTQFGELVEDQMAVTSHSHIDQVDVLAEEKVDDEYRVTLKVKLGHQPSCQNPSRIYRKTLAITGFAIVDPLQTSTGDLAHAEFIIPKYMLRDWQGSDVINPLDLTTTNIYTDADRAPTMNTHGISQRSRLVTGFNAQYVLTGVIRSLDIYHSQHIGQRLLKSIHMAEPERHFVLDLYLYDGFSGALISEKTVSATGRWSFGKRKVGMTNPVFWASDYGQAIKQSLQKATEFVEQFVQCQPFMARIKRADGHRLLIDSSASSNLRHGDTLNIYRTGDLRQDYFSNQRLLTSMNQTAQVKQVQPHFIIADMPISAENLAVQQDDMVIIW